MKDTLIVEMRRDFLATLQAVYEADTAVCEARVREAMIAVEKAQAALGEVRKKFPAQIPNR